MTEKNIYRTTAWLYDIEHGNNAPLPDAPFYHEYATTQCGENGEKGEILELGCGTGRVALALAKGGFRVTGLDLSHQMLDIFREKVAKEPPEVAKRIDVIHGNMADFKLGRKFALITAPFRVFQLITAEKDIEGALSCIRNHLADDGIFILNVFNPNQDPLDQTWCREEIFIGELTHEETGIQIARYECREKIDTANQIIYPYLAYKVTHPDGTTERLVEPLQMKYYYSPQLRALVESAGFTIMDEYSWYDKTRPTNPVDEKHPNSRTRGREIIFTCKLTRN